MKIARLFTLNQISKAGPLAREKQRQPLEKEMEDGDASPLPVVDASKMNITDATQ